MKNKDNKFNIYYKQLSKKQKIFWLVAIILLLAIIATAISVPLALKDKAIKIPMPEIINFNQKSDSFVVVKWDKIQSANSYSLEYYYSNDGIVVPVNNIKLTQYPIERQKYILFYRVRANFGNYFGEFSDWKQLAVQPLILPTVSSITLSDNGKIFWDKVQYINNGVAKDVYAYNVVYQFVDKSNATIYDIDENVLDIKSAFSSIIYIPPGEGEKDTWEDITLRIKITALPYGIANLGIYPEILTDGKYKFIYNAYDKSEVSTTNILITKDKYLRIRG